MPESCRAARIMVRGLALGLAVALVAPPAVADDLWQQDSLTGDWGGERSALRDMGVALGASEIGEILGNPTGGVRRGATFDGRLELDLDLDLEKLAGWHGAVFHANAYWVQGRGLSRADLANNILTPSNIEAMRALRLFDLYLEQTLLDGEMSVRAGQIAADDEFLVSTYAGTFVNSTFGFPGVAASDLPSGGPAYPLATPGIRVKVTPTDRISWLSAVFNGDPGGAPGPAEPEIRNPSGTNFSLDQGAYIISELAYAVPADADSGTLPATYKVGAWYHSGEFADQRLDRFGQSLAGPSSDGIPRNHQGDYSIYVVADRMLWQVPGTDDHGLGAFLRLAGSPDDRNPVALYADAGLTYKAPIDGRDDDVAGLAFAFAQLSSASARLDQDIQRLSDAAHPVRDHEAVVELTYQYAAAPWWLVQPDLQYVMHPAGNIPDPARPNAAKPIGDAVVLGLRSSIKF